MGPGTKNTLSLLATFAAAWFLLRFFLPLVSPFLLGLGLALSAEPMTGFLSKRLGLPRSVSAGIGVSMAFCFLAMLVLLLCAFLVRELGILAGALPDLEETALAGISQMQNWLLSLTSRTPRSIQPLLRDNVTALFSNGTALLDKALRYGLSLAGSLLSHIPDSALGLGTAAISGFMISAKLPRIRRWLKRRVPKEKLQPILATLGRIKTALLGWLLAQCKLMGLTFGILLLGFWILGIPKAPLCALGVALVDAFPVLGTGTVLLPWALLNILRGNTVLAIGLAAIYIIITLTRSTLEPRLLGRHLGLDPLATLMALYAGYKLWGIGGMILAPLLTTAALQLVPDRRRGKL